MLDKIIAIAGKPGLYRIIAKGHNNLIVESLDQQRKRQTLFPSQKAVSLKDISIYTNDGREKPLATLLQNALTNYDKQPAPLHHKKSSDQEITAFFAKALPDYDTQRVKVSDMRKALCWYNILAEAGITDLTLPENPAE